MSCLSRLSFAVLAALIVASCPALLNAQAPAADKPAEKADKFAVPEGTNKDLADFLMKMNQYRPKSKEEAEQMREAVLKAADKLLANNPNPQELFLGAIAKASSLGDPAKVEQFAEELKTAGHEDLARQIRGIGLIQKLQQMNIVVKDPKNPPTAEEIFKPRVKEALEYLASSKGFSQIDVYIASIAGQQAEITGDYAFAAETYGRIKELLSATGDKRYEPTLETIEAVLRRLALIGKEMTIEGTVVGGGKFDMSKYNGKVLLVNIFATWCGPCQVEIANMRKYYDLYHDKGLEVVALSGDHDPAALNKYLAEKKLPWPVVYDDKKPSPTLAYYGIHSFPQLILIGRDGKVISLNVRGEALPKALEQLLGPAEEKEKPAKPSY
jgi:thiol-disulfide isomerase/thioredoxin